MPIPNLDTIRQQRDDILAAMAAAMQANDHAAMQRAFSSLADSVGEELRSEFAAQRAGVDAAILTGRGSTALTSAERQFYENVTQAMRSDNPRQALANINTALPETVIARVFDDLRTSHPLLSAIDFQWTGALTSVIVATTSGNAGWGALDSTAASELSASFTAISLTSAALTAYMPIPRAVLDMGPAWLDSFVRRVLTAAMTTHLVSAIVDGDGQNKPIGMSRALTGAVDGAHPRKQATGITALDATTYGRILSTLSTDASGNDREVGEVLLLVNPSDYYTKIMPATTVRAADGSYAREVFPYPTRCIPCPGVPSNKAIMGIAGRYFMGLGSQEGGRLEYDDSVKFIERQRVYAISLYGNGRALDENAFVYLDITDLAATNQKVEIVGAVTTVSAS